MEIVIETLEKNITKVKLGEEKSTENKLTGEIELDIQNQSKFVETINTLFESGKMKLIIDMSLVSYIDSSGLWAIFESHKKVSQKKGDFILLNPAKDVQRVLDITKISNKLTILKSDNDAIQLLTQNKTKNKVKN